MQCEQFLAQIDAYCQERLEGGERQSWREHFASCASCREVAVATDPALLFAGDGVDENRADHADVERCVTAVAAMIRHDRIERRVQTPHRRRTGWWIAAAALMICTFAAMLWHSGGPGVSSAPVVAVAEQEPPGGPAAGEPVVVPPTVEVEMDDVRVYQFASSEDEVVEVLIVNPALQL